MAIITFAWCLLFVEISKSREVGSGVLMYNTTGTIVAAASTPHHLLLTDFRLWRTMVLRHTTRSNEHKKTEKVHSCPHLHCQTSTGWNNVTVNGTTMASAVARWTYTEDAVQHSLDKPNVWVLVLYDRTGVDLKNTDCVTTNVIVTFKKHQINC